MELVILKSILKKREYITPNYARLTFSSDDIHSLSGLSFGDGCKIYLPPKEGMDLHMPDIENGNILDKGNPEAAIYRTYTIRRYNIEEKEIVIDFALHGGEGLACNFAKNAKEGDPIGIVAIKGVQKISNDNADYILLIGDSCAIPAFSAMLERLPAERKGNVIIEVQTKEDIQELKCPENMKISWVINPNPGEGDALLNKTKEILSSIPSSKETDKFCYLAAEQSAVKSIKRLLKRNIEWEKRDFVAYPYWTYNKNEIDSEIARSAENTGVPIWVAKLVAKIYKFFFVRSMKKKNRDKTKNQEKNRE